MIYLDNNATTPLDSLVLEAMMPYFTTQFGNPGSIHRLGLEAERAVKKAREQISSALGVKSKTIVFTSGATESINWAIRSAVKINRRKGKHLITSAIEHDAVLSTCNALKEEGFSLTYLKPDKNGKISPSQIIEALQTDTALVILMHVHNELGTIYPIEEVARKIKERDHSILFFVDGVQAFGKISADLSSIDFYAMSGHKIHGPKGVGALYIREGITITPLIYGGGQEFSLRSGTQNVPAIVGFGKATELAYSNLEAHRVHIRKLNEQLREGMSSIDDIYIASPDDGIEGTLNVAFLGIPAEVLVHQLEEEQIYISAGAACTSRKNTISHVLEALPISDEVKKSSVRIGLSRFNTEDEISKIVTVIQKIVPMLRGIIPKRYKSEARNPKS